MPVDAARASCDPPGGVRSEALGQVAAALTAGRGPCGVTQREVPRGILALRIPPRPLPWVTTTATSALTVLAERIPRTKGAAHANVEVDHHAGAGPTHEPAGGHLVMSALLLYFLIQESRRAKARDGAKASASFKKRRPARSEAWPADEQGYRQLGGSEWYASKVNQ